MISLNLVIPRYGVKSVSGAPNTPISALIKSLPNQNVELVYQGVILNAKDTIDGYSMKSNDCIIVVPIASEERQNLQTWLAVTKSSDDLQARVSACLNGDARREVVRLRDLELLRRESQSRRFARKTPQVHSEQIEIKSRDDFTIFTDSPSAIREDPLPCPWKQSPQSQPVVRSPQS
jgi:hypothetical protein